MVRLAVRLMVQRLVVLAVAVAGSVKVIKAVVRKRQPTEHPLTLQDGQAQLPQPTQSASGRAGHPQLQQPVQNGLGYPQQPGLTEHTQARQPGTAELSQPREPGSDQPGSSQLAQTNQPSSAERAQPDLHIQASKPHRPARLLNLPPAVLDSIMALLPTLDRFRLLTCCWRLSCLSAASTSLWADISVQLDSPTRLLHFVAALGRPGVAQRLRRLRITHKDVSPVVDWSTHVNRHLVTALAGASSLELLDWTLPPGVSPRLTVWAGSLPRLRSLSLTSQGAVLQLPACFGPGMRSLQELRIHAHASLEPGRLPPSLRRLEIWTEEMSALPPAILAATQLTELCLQTKYHRSIELAGLTQLSALRRLALRNAPINRAVFDQVAQLPLLESLDLSAALRDGPLLMPSFGGITQLSRLRKLSLKGLGLRQLPRALLRMLSLEALHLEGNPQLKLAHASARACQVQLLTLDAEAADIEDNLRALACMPRLQQLHISNSAEAVPGASSALVAREVRRLREVQQAGGGPTKFCGLPPTVLDAIMVLLPARDRFRLLACCWSLYDLSPASTSLWEDVSVRLDSPTHLFHFVAALGRPGVAQRLRRLRISPAVVAHLDWSTHVCGLVTVLAGASSLELLDWTLPPVVSPRLDLWAGSLTGLRSLSLTRPGAVLQLPACFGPGLPSLEELRIHARASLQPGCLPPSLWRLDIWTEEMSALLPAILAATQLTELCLQTKYHRSIELAGLAQLPALRRLALRNVPINRAVFDQVAQLPLLESLDLSAALWDGPLLMPSFGGITQLSRLRELSLKGLGLRQLPRALLCMLSLEALHLEGNTQLKLAHASARACQVQLLTLDAEAADFEDNLRALASMPRLQQLHISNSAEAVPGASSALVAREVRRLREVQQAGGRPTKFCHLPPTALDTILALLPACDRFRLLACCWDLYLLSLASTSLWEDVSVRLDSPTHMHQFIAAMGRPGVAQRLRRLRITHKDVPPWSWCRCIQTLANALAGASFLQVLEWTTPLGLGPRLNGWAGSLPRLRSLSLTSQGAPLTLPMCFSPGLPSLQELCIYADADVGYYIKLEPGCLPPSLRRLVVYDGWMTELPPAIVAATQLTELCLRTTNSWLKLTGLVELTGLHRLALLNIITTRPVFDLLARLPLLESLDLSARAGDGRQHLHLSRLDGITQLRTLRELCLGGLGLTQLPEGLLIMPNLKRLHLEGNPRVQLVLAYAPACRLQLLTLDAEAVACVGNFRTLAGMVYLQQLHISNSVGTVPGALLSKPPNGVERLRKLWQPVSGPTGLMNLPADVLDKILAFLPAQDRFRLLACCWQLYRLSGTSTNLWADVSVRLDSPVHLHNFMTALRRPGVALRLRQLRITHNSVSSAAWSNSHAQDLVTALTGASSLELLDWALPPGVSPRLDLWAGRLTGLRSLSLRGQFVALLPACFGQGLPSLQELYVRACMWLVPDCLPPSLQRLELYVMEVRELPPAVMEATQLTELYLQTNHTGVELVGLLRLTGLRRLALRAFPLTRQAFDHMAGLPLLESLDLSSPLKSSPTHVPRFDGITQLSKLRELCLRRLGLQQLPRALLRMPSLEALHLEGNPKLKLPLASARGCQVQLLILDAEAAFCTGNLRALATMPRLQQLHTIDSTGPVSGASSAPLAREVQKLRKLQQAGTVPMELFDLPHTVLDIILALLQACDRFRLLACCWDLYLLSPASTSLWADISVRLESPTHLHHFVTALGRPGVTQRLRRLCISHSMSPVRWRNSHALGLITVLAGASTLELLEWTIPPGVSLNGGMNPTLAVWAGRLQSLRCLSLRSQGVQAAVPLQLPACLGPGLPSLQELCISGWAWLVPGCLPHSLQWLELYDMAMRELPPAIVAATQLTELRLRTDNTRIELAGLTRLSGLRQLALLAIPINHQVFDLLARLPLLESLDLYQSVALRMPLFDGITQLRTLRELCLGDLGLRLLPRALLRLPSLEALHLEGNPQLKLPLASARGCQVQLLTLDAEAADNTGSLRALASMPYLQQLHITNIAGAVPGTSSALVTREVQRLRELQQAGRGPVEFFDLPPTVLDAVMNLLPAGDRFRLLACCWDLYLLSPTSTSLWADVSVRLESPTHLRQFVTALGRPGVTQRLRRLRISHSEASPVDWSSCIQLLATVLAGASSLELLDWTLPPGVSPRLTVWAGSLRRLCSLSLSSQGAVLQLPACLGPGLPSLRRLELYVERIAELPPALVAATQLTELCLRTNNSSIELAGLVRLTGLHRLALRDVPITSQVFSHLAKLTLLENLDLSAKKGGCCLSFFDGITQLSTLRELRHGGRGLQELPECLLCMPNLQALHLEDNPHLRLPWVSPRACSLQVLTQEQLEGSGEHGPPAAAPHQQQRRGKAKCSLEEAGWADPVEGGAHSTWAVSHWQWHSQARARWPAPKD